MSYAAIDRAGNVEPGHTLVVSIDRTPPAISGLPGAGCSLWPPNHKLVTVATVTASDAVSGPARFAVNASSTDPAAVDADMVVGGSGVGARTVALRAEKAASGARTYTIAATATDLAGNTAAASATCAVPADQAP